VEFIKITVYKTNIQKRKIVKAGLPMDTVKLWEAVDA
jgi:hypothetical protein